MRHSLCHAGHTLCVVSTSRALDQVCETGRGLHGLLAVSWFAASQTRPERNSPAASLECSLFRFLLAKCCAHQPFVFRIIKIKDAFGIG